METAYISIIAFLLGSLLWLIGWIWLMVIAFSTDHWGHGVGILLSCDIYGFVYGLMNWDLCRIPLILHASGFVLVLGVGSFGG
jgi:hypothetical protein